MCSDMHRRESVLSNWELRGTMPSAQKLTLVREGVGCVVDGGGTGACDCGWFDHGDHAEEGGAAALTGI